MGGGSKGKGKQQSGRPETQRVSRAAVSTAPSGQVLAAVLFVAALIGLLVPAVPKQEIGMGLIAGWIGLTGTAAVVGLAKLRALRVDTRGPGVAWAALLGWLFVTAAVPGRFWAALAGEPTNRLGWLVLAALTAVVLASSVTAERVRHLLRSYAWLIVLAEAIYTLFQVTVGQDPSIVGGTLPNSTYLGEALVLLLPWTLPEAGTPRSTRKLRYAAIGITVFTLAAIQSRGPLLVVGLWLAWVLARRWKARVHVKIAAVAVLAALGLAATLTFLPASVFDPDGSLPFGGRLAAWQLSAQAVAERPLTGFGADSYYPAAASVRTVAEAERTEALIFGTGATDPHNTIVWMALAGGVVAVALWLWFLGSVALSWRRTPGDRSHLEPAAWSLGGCLAVGLVSPVILHVLPLFALVLGASLTPRDSAQISASDKRLPGWVRPAVTGVLLVTSLTLALNSLTRAPFEIAGAERSPGLARAAVTASSLWPADAHLAYLASLHSGWAFQADPASGWREADRAALDRAVRLDTRNPFYALERALATGDFGTADEVDAAFAEAFERYPAFPTARAEYARYLAFTGRIDEARAQLEMIAGIDDTDPARAEAVAAAQAAIDAAESQAP